MVSRVHSHVRVAGVDLLADVCGALFHEADGVLLVADLHLEKGSSFARRGLMLPPYDTAATLAKLGAVVARTRPRLVVALGDSFHDRAGASRMGEADRAALAALQAGRDWVWLAGNHDPAPPEGLGGTTAATWSLGPLTLRHEPLPGAPAGEIAGHLHPVAIVAGAGGAVRRRAFVSDGTRCIHAGLRRLCGRAQLPPSGLRRPAEGRPPHRPRARAGPRLRHPGKPLPRRRLTGRRHALSKACRPPRSGAGGTRMADQAICSFWAAESDRAGPSTGSSPSGAFCMTENCALPSRLGPSVQRPAMGGVPSAAEPKNA